MFCKQCGNEIPDAAAICMKCGVATGGPIRGVGVGSRSRISYILLGLFLGCLGMHNFYAGYTGRGVAQILITILIGWLIIPLLIVWIWVIVEVCTVTEDATGSPFAS
ncbi:MAG: NINE protein [Phycisphaerales bacterium]|nr:NINE protein [Phycisphaerales bacterium]